MSIITNVFTERRERARAIGLWGAVIGSSVVSARLSAPADRDHRLARDLLVTSIGVAAIVLAAHVRARVEGSPRSAGRPVRAGCWSSSACRSTYSIIEAPRAGWGAPLIWGGLLLAAASLAALVRYEPRRRDRCSTCASSAAPRSPVRRSSHCAFAAFAGSSSSIRCTARCRGYSALETGLCLLPMRRS